ncbi:MAG: beta-N-acetylhexosaminidase [Spirochaetota bacterium]
MNPMNAIRNPATLSLEEKIGQMLLIGFPAGKEGLDHLSRAIDEFAAGNFILFSRNVRQPEDVYKLTAFIRSAVLKRVALPPLIAVDQEGGIVARVKDGVTPIPGAMSQAAAVAGGAISIGDLCELGRICGTELAALGINWNLAPVADVNNNPANPVIGVRSYGDDPQKVAEMSAAFSQGLAEAGVLATGKHFPGHGDTKIDSHLGLPVIDIDSDRLEQVELVPFRRLISQGIGAIMTAHVRFPAVEAEALPATLSRRIVDGLLRKKLGFTGLITSDCLEMRAIADHYPDAGVLAVEAGVDMLDISHTFELQKEAARALVAAVREGRIAESRIDESVVRILAAKSALATPCETWEEAKKNIAVPSSFDLSRSVHKASLSLVVKGAGLPPSPDFVYVDVTPHDLTGVEDSSAGTGKAQTVSWFLTKAKESRVVAIPVSIDPTEEEIARVLVASVGRDVVMGLFRAVDHEAQTRLAVLMDTQCRRNGKKLAFVSMRGPYDASVIRRALGGNSTEVPRAFMCAYEYTGTAAEFIAEFLLRPFDLEGIVPVAGVS